MSFNFSQVHDSDESLLSKGSAKFGLNQGYLKTLAYNPNGGKDGAPLSSCDITVTIEDKDYFMRLFEPVGVLKSGNNTLKPGNTGYEKVYNDQMTQVVATIKHCAKAVGLQDAQLDAIQANDFASWCTAVSNILPQNKETILLDIFLEYQYSIREGQNKTYPILPTNMKGGRFICQHIVPVGSWKPITESDGALHYEDDNKNIHPFKRNAAFMNSNKGKQQGADTPSSPMSMPNLGGNGSQSALW